MNVVEVRCPVGPRKLFTKLKLGEEFGKYVAGNLIEFTCSDCARRLSLPGHSGMRVFHSFNFIGELVSTRVEPKYRVCLYPGCFEHGTWQDEKA